MPLMDKFARPQHAGEKRTEINSILDNLNNLLNTRQGFGSFLKDFGVRDMNEYTSRDHLSQAVLDEVKLLIETYEPRVKLTNVATEDNADPFTLSFKIDCVLKDDPRSLRLVFDSIYNNFHWDRSKTV